MWRLFRKTEALLLFIGLVVSSLGAAGAAGAAAPGGSLNLNQAIDLALQENPAIKQSRENVAAARYNIGVARSAYLPQVNFVSNYFYGNAFPGSSNRPGTSGTSGSAASIGGLGVTNFYLYQFQANQLIYDFGKTPGLINESRASFGQSQQDYAGSRQQVVLDARTAYFGYLAATRAQKVSEETVRQNQELLKQAQGFYQVGLKAKIDVTKAEANLYQAQANLIQAKNNVQLAQVSLMTALGLKTWPYSQVEDVLEVMTPPKSLEELRAQALQRRPEIQKNLHQQEFNKAGLQVARAGYFPTLTSTAAYGWQSLDQPFATLPSNWYVGAAMTFPLFEGFSTAYSVNQNKAQLRASLENYEVLRLNVTKEVNQSYLNVKTGWELIRATKKALEAARENLRLAWGRYQAGVGTIIEFTDAQVQFSQADLNFVQALYNYRVYEAQLDKAIGRAF
ncbi:MAG: TolC family protein [Syntrophobacterales bacterium]|jgi:TolC family type I secretion outer membrane protein|nr:TolC family protein [Syntrophobacterales bacterium]